MKPSCLCRNGDAVRRYRPLIKGPRPAIKISATHNRLETTKTNRGTSEWKGSMAAAEVDFGATPRVRRDPAAAAPLPCATISLCSVCSGTSLTQGILPSQHARYSAWLPSNFHQPQSFAVGPPLPWAPTTSPSRTPGSRTANASNFGPLQPSSAFRHVVEGRVATQEGRRARSRMILFTAPALRRICLPLNAKSSRAVRSENARFWDDEEPLCLRRTFENKGVSRLGRHGEAKGLM